MKKRSGLTEREKEILNLINTDKYTVKQVAYRLKTSVQYIYKVIKKLEKEGSIIKNLKGLKLNQKKSGYQTNLNHYDFLRLHSIEVHLKCLRSNVVKIKKKVLKNIEKYDVKIGGQSKNVFFQVGRVCIMITNKKNLFMFYPRDFEVVGNSFPELWSNFEFEYAKDANNLYKEFRVIFYKKGRSNYEIVDRHLSLVNNGIARELKEDKISNEVRVYDDQDGKTAYMFDLSKGQHEWESPHPNKAEHYIHLASQLMDFVKRGKMTKIIKRSNDIEAFFKDYDKFKDEFKLVKESSLMFLEKEASMKNNITENNPPDDKPFYVG